MSWQVETYRQAVERAGVIALAGWSTIRVAGKDRASFLHNMCTNDIRGLAPGGGCEAFFTDVKGKIVAHAFVLAGDEAMQLVGVPGMAGRLIAHLDRYIIREDVQLADESAERDWALAVGADCEHVLSRGAKRDLSSLANPWSHARLAFGTAEIDAQLIRCPLPWCGGFLMVAAADHFAAVRDALCSEGAIACPDEVWHTIRVESAWPMWGVDFDDSNLPQEVNRDAAAIHFRKGCYLGQETVARIDALGHVNKKLVQVRFFSEHAPPTGAGLLRGGDMVGRVTSACRSPKFEAPLALAMVKRGANDSGTQLEWDGAAAEVLATQ